MANTKASPNPVDFPTRAELPAAVYRPENSVSKASRTSALFFGFNRLTCHSCFCHLLTLFIHPSDCS
jgi:hypothetical protein